MTRSNKILVSGSSVLCSELHKFVGVLGRKLIRDTSFVLITGGLKCREPGTTSTDFVVASSANEACEQLNIDASQRIITMLPQFDRTGIERFTYGSVIYVQHSYTKSRRYSMVLTSDAVIAIGGQTNGTGENVDLAWVASKPVLPLPSTGGAAKECWEKYGRTLVSRFKMSSEDIALLQNPAVHAESLADLCITLIKRCLKPRCFVAMQLRGHPLPGAYETIKGVVEDNNFAPFRIDLETFVGDIVDAIWEAIRQSEIVIADVTGYNPNVFYELGIAHALGKPTIIVIHNMHGRVPDDVPFDIKVQRLLSYGTLDTLRRHIEEQIQHICPIKQP